MWADCSSEVEPRLKVGERSFLASCERVEYDAEPIGAELAFIACVPPRIVFVPLRNEIVSDIGDAAALATHQTGQYEVRGG